jgi:hypothetical protein
MEDYSTEDLELFDEIKKGRTFKRDDILPAI